MKTLTIGKKIAFGFASLVIIAGLLGLLSIWNMKSAGGAARILATEFVPETSIASNLQTSLAASQLAVRSYGLTAEEKYLKDTRTNLEEAKKHLQKAHDLADEHPNLIRLKKELTTIDSLISLYEKAIGETESNNREILAAREVMNHAAADYSEKLERLIVKQERLLDEEIKSFTEVPKLLERASKVRLSNDIRTLGNLTRIAAFKSQALRDPKLIKDAMGIFAGIEEKFAEILPLIHLPQDQSDLAAVRKDFEEYQHAMAGLLEYSNSLNEIAGRRTAAAAKLGELAHEITETGLSRTTESANASSARLTTASATIVAGLVVAIITGIAIAFYIIVSTTRTLTRVASALDEGADQVAAAASQVSASSQSLAEGASEQAASLEETSASLEEISSMTKRNAESATHAKELSGQTKAAADVGAADMEQMKRAMDAIKASSDGISKIIKTIDEIAFQTNILALNAAVEAARAGEAGMGFAVVADEVRSLAQRSAQSAKETAGKIEEAIQKSAHGVVISGKVASSLSEIVDKARKVDLLVAEIATASLEQNQGIGQVNTAVSQMDNITQSNAGNAEETAAAAEELSAQSVAMRENVAELKKLVSGEGQKTRSAKPLSTPAGNKSRPAPERNQPAVHRTVSATQMTELHPGEIPVPAGKGRHDAHFDNF